MTLVSRDTSPDEQLADAIAEYYDDPLGHVIFSYPWDTEKSIQLVNWYDEAEMRALKPEGRTVSVWEIMEPYRKRFPNIRFGPDWWACEFLDDVGAEVRARGFDGSRSVAPIQFATVSGHGIGKSVLVAWIILWIMSTRPYAMGVVTANTEPQLRTKTWAQVGKWWRMSATAHWFDYNSGRGSMSLVHKIYKEQWRCDAQTCKEENSEAFAGLHAANSTPFYIFDEGSGVPDKIFEVREGGTTDGEPMTFDFGNPTKNSGRLYEECQGRFRHRYRVRTIDSRTVYITNKERIKQWIDDYGVESDFVKVRVLGRFPSAGSLQFMPTADVEMAMQREYFLDRSAPLILGVDVARHGDDESVIYPRIGMDARSFAPKPGEGRYQGLDTVQLTGRIVETIRRFRDLGKEYSAIFVDGTGIGGAVYDNLLHLGYGNIFEVQFGGSPTDTAMYRFKGDEIWGELRTAIKNRLLLPEITSPSGVTLKEQLTQREFGYTTLGNKIHLESKRDMKERLSGEFSSPDIADGLACTFAQTVAAVSVGLGGNTDQGGKTVYEYDPLEG